MPSAEYYLKQAETASRMALAESNPVKMRAMHLLALEMFDKAKQAEAGEHHQPQGKKEIRRRE
ncbi:hypothetical protein [Bradyrhizobium sp. 6(2017)]|uniref:hypothetical protein n=1 Tax=Bradyrhizobium sp. 6(2017) TaxID=1197460 RepID=UPI0013E11922|nr:hypothetical protein [Bradyrhizobium sp. 6(2017)]QIG96789.1 hypothetical protein G6P99_33215 [Bradyrhizobium sp. 6(2017)]